MATVGDDETDAMSPWTEIADQLASEMDADLILYSGSIGRPADHIFISDVKKRIRRKNVVLILVTQGGDADVAYRIARCLQKTYEKFTIFVSGFCKSAGTLLALGAHEVIFSDFGELGPLDVQFTKKDELWQASSALTVIDALDTLLYQSFDMFQHYFMQIKRRSDDAITFRTSTNIAAQIAVGLFTPIYQQIDPMYVGEAGRSLKIAEEYGQRLATRGGNFDPAVLSHLISHYPSHSFVIEREEVEELFEKIRAPTILEEELCEKLGLQSRLPDGGNGLPTIIYLNTQKDVIGHAEDGDTTDENSCDQPDGESAAEGKTGSPSPSSQKDGGHQENP